MIAGMVLFAGGIIFGSGITLLILGWRPIGNVGMAANAGLATVAAAGLILLLARLRLGDTARVART